jgi:hypothetical protein
MPVGVDRGMGQPAPCVRQRKQEQTGSMQGCTHHGRDEGLATLGTANTTCSSAGECTFGMQQTGSPQSTHYVPLIESMVRQRN